MAASCKGWLIVPPLSSLNKWLAGHHRRQHPWQRKRRRGYAPAHGSLQSALLFPTVRARGPLIFPVADGLFQRRAHGLLPGFLDLLFHLS